MRTALDMFPQKTIENAGNKIALAGLANFDRFSNLLPGCPGVLWRFRREQTALIKPVPGWRGWPQQHQNNPVFRGMVHDEVGLLTKGNL
jgi:hypothetical protein